jgi:DNA-binding NarL/FixJ family response regulator
MESVIVPRPDPDERAKPGPPEPSADASGGRSGGGAPPRITDRQLEILVHVARGRTNRQIGQALGISERTVRNHLQAILHKLASTDRTQAVVVAIERGWIAIPIEPEMADLPANRGPVRPGSDADEG